MQLLLIYHSKFLGGISRCLSFWTLLLVGPLFCVCSYYKFLFCILKSFVVSHYKLKYPELPTSLLSPTSTLFLISWRLKPSGKCFSMTYTFTITDSFWEGQELSKLTNILHTELYRLKNSLGWNRQKSMKFCSIKTRSSVLEWLGILFKFSPVWKER